ncbi:tail fiber protein, partial [Vibrio cortegadensis]
MSELTRDIRCYLTNAGRQAELDALKNGTVLEIVSMVIDSALLPDDQDPKDLTEAISPIADTYPLMVSTDGAKGKISFLSDIPSSAGMFTINGFAWMTNTGVLYAYARGLGDIKRPAESGQNDVLRIEAELVTENAIVINHTYDDSQIYATHFELNESIRLHIESADPHVQYEHKSNAATNAEIDASSTAEKHVKLPQLWRAFLNKVKPASLLIAGIVQLSNKYNGTSQTKATTEKALTDGLKTKSNAVHKHSASDINAGTLAKERLPNASTTAKGASQLNDTVTSTSKTQSLTANMGRYIWAKAVGAYDLAASKMTQATADGRYWKRTETVTNSTKLDNKTYSQLYTAIRQGLSPNTNTWRSISDVVNSTSSDISASLRAVKTAYDKGVSAYNLAASKMTQATADGRYWKRTETVTNSTKLDNKTYSQLYTAIRAGLSPNTNTWRSISDVVNSTSSDISASLRAVKTAYDKGVSAYNLAASKMTQSTADGRYLILDSSKGATIAARYLMSGSSNVGTKIRLPYKTNSGKMVAFTIRVYQGYQVADIQISGYLYESTNQWHCPAAVMIAGTGNIEVTMGRDENGYAYAWLSGGNYKGVAVLDVVGGYSYANWNTGWVISETNSHPNAVLSKTIHPPFSPNNPNISDSVATVSSTVYASLTAVKAAYDKAALAYNQATEALSIAHSKWTHRSATTAQSGTVQLSTSVSSQSAAR